MTENVWKKLGALALAGLGLYWGVKYALPILLPFLVGGAIALMAEPLVKKCARVLPRGVAAGVGVSLSLLLLVGLISLVGAVAVRELSRLGQALPQVQSKVGQGVALLRQQAQSFVSQLPEQVQPVVQKMLPGEEQLTGQATGKVVKTVTAAVQKLPAGAVGFWTMLISSFMISARLPRLRSFATAKLRDAGLAPMLQKLKEGKKTLTKWLAAQGKLAAVTFCLVTVGFVILKVPYAPVWGLLVALVDAMPILGTGTVLIPWAVIALLSGEHLQAIGILVIYAAALITRTTLEPRLVGQQLGMDPLLILLLLYVGFRLFGVLGMVAAPIVGAMVKSVISAK